MITRDEYFAGRDHLYLSDWTPEIEKNAQLTVARANELLTAFGEDRTVNSGWRPPEVNAKTPGASATSLHMTGQAIDIHDDDGTLDQWCYENQDVLARIGLWLEHPDDTPRWCHVQTVAPHSGNRVFYSK